MKNRKLTSVCIIVFSYLLIVFLVIGCHEQKIDDEKPFLDLNILENTILSDRELIVLAEAYERVNSYIISYNDRWEFVLKSAEEVNISERLYLFIAERIKLANDQRAFYRQLARSGINIDIPKYLGSYSTPRLKSGAEYDVFYGFGYTIQSLTLSHNESISLLNALQSSSGDAGQFTASIGLLFPYCAAGAYIVSTYFWMLGSEFSNFENNYLQSGSTNGITLTTSTYYLLDGGLPATIYNSYIN